MKKNKLLIIFYTSLVLTGLVFLYAQIKLSSLWWYIFLALPILLAIWLIFKKRITKKLLASIGLIILFQTSTLVGLYILSEQDTVAISTEDFNQLTKIQEVLIDKNYIAQAYKSDTKYKLTLHSKNKELADAIIAIAQKNLLNKNTILEIGIPQDYEHPEKHEKALKKHLTEILSKINGVNKLDIDIKISKVPTAKINVETENQYIPQRIENTIRNILLATIPTLTENNIKIEIKTTKCSECIFGTEYYKTAKELYKEGKYSEALELLEKEQELFPNASSSSLINLKEIIKLNEEISKTPTNSELYIKRANLKNFEEYPIFLKGNDQGITADFSSAVEDYTKALELNPNDKIIYSFRADAYKGLKEYDKALEDYQKALLHAKNLSVFENYILLNIADCYFAKNEYQKALEYYEQLPEEEIFLKQDAGFALPFDYRLKNYTPFKLATCYKELKQKEQLKNIYNKIILFSTDNRDKEFAQKELDKIKH